MSRISINRDPNITLWNYSVTEIVDVKTAVEWIARVMETPFFETKCISLRDLDARNDEGNTSTELTGSISEVEILTEVKSRYIDKVTLSGTFNGNRVTIGVDLRSKNISVVLKNKSASLITEIEEALQLLD